MFLLCLFVFGGAGFSRGVGVSLSATYLWKQLLQKQNKQRKKNRNDQNSNEQNFVELKLQYLRYASLQK